MFLQPVTTARPVAGSTIPLGAVSAPSGSGEPGPGSPAPGTKNLAPLWESFLQSATGGAAPDQNSFDAHGYIAAVLDPNSGLSEGERKAFVTLPFMDKNMPASKKAEMLTDILNSKQLTDEQKTSYLTAILDALKADKGASNPAGTDAPDAASKVLDALNLDRLSDDQIAALLEAILNSKMPDAQKEKLIQLLLDKLPDDRKAKILKTIMDDPQVKNAAKSMLLKAVLDDSKLTNAQKAKLIQAAFQDSKLSPEDQKNILTDALNGSKPSDTKAETASPESSKTNSSPTALTPQATTGNLPQLPAGAAAGQGMALAGVGAA